MSRGRGDFPLVDRILEAPVIWLITALNIAIFVTAWTHGDHSEGELSPATLLAFGACDRYRIWFGEYWRLLTAVFLHVGWLHLLWNTWAMFGWCAMIERSIGSRWFSFAYLTTGVGGFALSVLCQRTLSAGASGAGFGMIGLALAVLFRRAGSFSAFLSSPGVKRVLVWAGLWIALGLLAMSRMDTYAHLGGLAFGVPCGFLVEKRRGRAGLLRLAGISGYLLVLAGVIVAACRPRLAG